MRSPALAIAWEFRQRYRWGLIALVGYLLLMVTTRLLVFDQGQVNLDEDLPFIGPRFAATVIAPLSLFTYWLLAVFSFGLTGNLAARESMYPARMFALPVTTAALAGWPMLYGSAVIAGLWTATARFAVLPSGVDLPLMWPVFLAVAFLAWIQVFMWMPYGLPGLRVIVGVCWLTTIDAIVFTAIDRKVPEAVMIAFLAPQIPLAYLCARFAVARARRGDVPDWRGKFARLGAIRRVPASGRDHFPTAARAQAWFEWRQHGLSLPTWVGILLPFELAFLLVPGTSALVVYTVFGVLLTPPFMAAFVAHGARKPGPHVSDAEGLPPFIATRPVATSALIAAKLRMSIWSTLAAWLLVVIAVPVALTLSDTWPVVIERARQVRDAVGTPRAVVAALLLLTGLVASTWKQLVQGLYVGLSGRGWLIKASASVTLGLVTIIEPVYSWIRDNDNVRIAIWIGLPWFLAVLVCVKVSAAVWLAPRLQASGLFNDRVLVTGAACWLVAVLALYGVLVWLVLGPLIPRYILLLLAILSIPLARVSAAPLALAWNRHR